MAVEIRTCRLPDDEPGIAAIDTAFATDSRYEIEASPRGFRLVETPIPRRVKRFEVYDLGQDWRQWDEAHVATDQARIIGFAASSFQFWCRRVVLWHLYVDPPYRKRGIGDRLLATAFERAEREQALAVFFETSNVNVPGVAWYEKRGFSLAGVDTTLYNSGEAAEEKALYFVKRLPQAK